MNYGTATVNHHGATAPSAVYLRHSRNPPPVPPQLLNPATYSRRDVQLQLADYAHRLNELARQIRIWESTPYRFDEDQALQIMKQLDSFESTLRRNAEAYVQAEEQREVTAQSKRRRNQGGAAAGLAVSLSALGFFGAKRRQPADGKLSAVEKETSALLEKTKELQRLGRDLLDLHEFQKVHLQRGASQSSEASGPSSLSLAQQLQEAKKRLRDHTKPSPYSRARTDRTVRELERKYAEKFGSPTIR